MPIRWRLAVVSAGLTGVILLLFAIAVGSFTAQRVRGDFQTETAARFDAIQSQMELIFDRNTLRYRLGNNLGTLSGDADTVINVWVAVPGGYTLVESSDPSVNIGKATSRREQFGNLQVTFRRFQQPVISAQTGKPITNPSVPVLRYDTGRESPLDVPSDKRPTVTAGSAYTASVVVRMGRSFATVNHTTRRIWGALAVGVVAGTLLALIAGLAVGQRAMQPVRRMTSTARHIARTRDLDAKMPVSPVHDEISDLAGTLQDMLDELAAAQVKVDATLQSQRDFIADASHELRTPLTSVQANLELLALTTTGEDHDAVESALRSSRRMRLLVSDLLLLARMDAQRQADREPVDLDRAILEAVDELGPQAERHEIALDLEPLTVLGMRDELVRMVANLVGNALRHTPVGTQVRVLLRRSGARQAELVVEDDGPGIPADLRGRIFERFVRRGGESAGSTGIGLAIVQAAAHRHGGNARVEPTHADGTGARFVITLAVNQEQTAQDDPQGRPPERRGAPD